MASLGKGLGHPSRCRGSWRTGDRQGLTSSASPHLILFLHSFCAAPLPLVQLLQGTDQGLTPCPP